MAIVAQITLRYVKKNTKLLISVTTSPKEAIQTFNGKQRYNKTQSSGAYISNNWYI